MRVKDLIIDERVADSVEARGGNIDKYINNFEAMGSFPLSDERLDSIIRAVREGVKLPPIDVKKVGRKYLVINGRHRIAVCILLGCDEISAKIIN